MSTKAVRKYLESHAEPEIELASSLGTYANALVVPAHDEDATFLGDLRPALHERALTIVVVNATADASAEVHASNARCLEGLIAASGGTELGPGAWLGSKGLSPLLVLDRSTHDRCLPVGEGVGLARKIGADVALALFAQGRLTSGWIHTTDADTMLPAGYFQAAPSVEAAAIVHAFQHVRGDDDRVFTAVRIYEETLRHYVEGLAWAGSPYAFPTIGSAVAIAAESYAAVRGFPRREAGEDFYMLNKLAKVGGIAQPTEPVLHIRARRSTRVPFGTGPATERILRQLDEGIEPTTYHPGIFVWLKRWLEILEEVAATGPPALEKLEAFEIRQIAAALEAPNAIAGLCRQNEPGKQRERALMEWFDAFRTLKFVHAARDRFLPDMPYRHARTELTRLWPETGG